MPPGRRYTPQVHLRDHDGGILILRGTNVGDDAKFTRDYGSSVGREALTRIRDDLGMNAVRLLVFWEAVEPREGAYDDAYIARVRARVRDARALGMHVVVDFHQDLFGAGFGMAGAPLWAADPSHYRGARRRTPWMWNYFELGVMRAFDGFWGSDGLQSQFAAAAARVGAALAGEGVLFYDLWNEPFWGSRTPGWLEREVLPLFYENVAEALRAADPDARFGLCSAAHTNAGFASTMPWPESVPRVGSAYTPHFYPNHVEVGGRYDGDAAVLGKHMDRVVADAVRMGVPLVFTELGIQSTSGDATAYVRDLYDALDARALSAFQWEASGHSRYTFWNREHVYNDLAAAFARPYPARIAGDEPSWRWDARAGVFECEWREAGSAGVSGDSLFVLPRLAFPGGAGVAVDGASPTEVDFRAPHHRVPRTGAPRRRISLSRV